MKQNVWVIIPGYNEGKNIGKVLALTKKFSKQIVVVDDGSRDNTAAVAAKYTPHVLRHVINLGKGNAVKTGCDYALEQGATHVIFMDSDGQHEPKDIPAILKELGTADILFTFRKFGGDMPKILAFGNWFIDKVSSTLFSIRVKDTQCGYRAMTAQAYKKVRWLSAGYGMESEMIARTAKHKLKYKQYPIATIYQDEYKGTTPLHGINIVLNMIWWRLTI
mgnify:CR=1 FL=1|jgi:glycosyltransferase involved in cell wall biosynthesis